MPDYDLGKVVGEDGTTPTVDTSLSTSSTNPVQNKVITTELNKKQTISGLETAVKGMTVDTVEDGNMYPVTSNAVYDLIGDIQEYVNR